MQLIIVKRIGFIFLNKNVYINVRVSVSFYNGRFKHALPNMQPITNAGNILFFGGKNVQKSPHGLNNIIMIIIFIHDICSAKYIRRG